MARFSRFSRRPHFLAPLCFIIDRATRRFSVSFLHDFLLSKKSSFPLGMSYDFSFEGWRKMLYFLSSTNMFFFPTFIRSLRIFLLDRTLFFFFFFFWKYNNFLRSLKRWLKLLGWYNSIELWGSFGNHAVFVAIFYHFLRSFGWKI